MCPWAPLYWRAQWGKERRWLCLNSEPKTLPPGLGVPEDVIWNVQCQHVLAGWSLTVDQQYKTLTRSLRLHIYQFQIDNIWMFILHLAFGHFPHQSLISKIKTNIWKWWKLGMKDFKNILNQNKSVFFCVEEGDCCTLTFSRLRSRCCLSFSFRILITILCLAPLVTFCWQKKKTEILSLTVWKSWKDLFQH